MKTITQKEFFDREFGEKITQFLAGFRKLPVASKCLNKIVFGCLEAIEGKEILEIGAGFGQFTIPLLALGVNVTAVDISEKSLLICRQMYDIIKSEQPQVKWGQLKILSGDFNSLIFEEKFDNVFSSNLLHHLDNPSQAVKKMACFTKPKGSVVILEPNPVTPLWYLYFKFLKRSWEIEKGIKNTHRNLMFEYFRGAGLSDIEMRRFGIVPLKMLNFSYFLEKINFETGARVPFYLYHIFRGSKV